MGGGLVTTPLPLIPNPPPGGRMFNRTIEGNIGSSWK